MAVDNSECNLYSAVRHYRCYVRLSSLCCALVVDVIFAPHCCSVVLVVESLVESLILEGDLCVLCNMGWCGFAMQALQRLVSM